MLYKMQLNLHKKINEVGLYKDAPFSSGETVKRAGMDSIGGAKEKVKFKALEVELKIVPVPT